MKKMNNYSAPMTEETVLEHMTVLCTSGASAEATGANGESGDGNGGNPLFPPFFGLP